MNSTGLFLYGKCLRNRLLRLPEPETCHWILLGDEIRDPEALKTVLGLEEQDHLILADSVEEVLAHSDLTIDAIARQTGEEALIDPYHGEDDLQDGFLRHCTPAFSSRPANLLDIASAGAELGRWGFRVAHGTYGLMKKMVVSGCCSELDAADKTRTLTAALEADRPSEYFRILHRCGALAQISPLIDGLFDPEPGHGPGELPEAIGLLDTKKIPDAIRDALKIDFGWQD